MTCRLDRQQLQTQHPTKTCSWSTEPHTRVQQAKIPRRRAGSRASLNLASRHDPAAQPVTGKRPISFRASAGRGPLSGLTRPQQQLMACHVPSASHSNFTDHQRGISQPAARPQLILGHGRAPPKLHRHTCIGQGACTSFQCCIKAVSLPTDKASAGTVFQLLRPGTAEEYSVDGLLSRSAAVHLFTHSFG